MKSNGFNPYSPGFSIYFPVRIPCYDFTPISFNPYSPGFSIYFKQSVTEVLNLSSFNPYSPGFSIYLDWREYTRARVSRASILIHLDFLSISSQETIMQEQKIASILIHLDFLSIWNGTNRDSTLLSCFNPYSPGFSIYFYGLG